MIIPARRLPELIQGIPSGTGREGWIEVDASGAPIPYTGSKTHVTGSNPNPADPPMTIFTNQKGGQEAVTLRSIKY